MHLRALVFGVLSIVSSIIVVLWSVRFVVFMSSGGIPNSGTLLETIAILALCAGNAIYAFSLAKEFDKLDKRD